MVPSSVRPTLPSRMWHFPGRAMCAPSPGCRTSALAACIRPPPALAGRRLALLHPRLPCPSPRHWRCLPCVVARVGLARFCCRCLSRRLGLASRMLIFLKRRSLRCLPARRPPRRRHRRRRIRLAPLPRARMRMSMPSATSGGRRSSLITPTGFTRGRVLLAVRSAPLRPCSPCRGSAGAVVLFISTSSTPSTLAAAAP